MDTVTGMTIIGSTFVVVGGIVSTIKYFKKPDETWHTPVKEIEEKHTTCERMSLGKINALDIRLTKAETQIEGMAEIRSNINKLEGKIDKLVESIMEWTQKP